MSELSSATTDTFETCLIIGSTIILMQVKDCTELYNKICYRRTVILDTHYDVF